MNVTARLRQLRISPRKTRLIARLIVGMSVNEAFRELRVLPKHAAEPILKLVRSAVANAEHNFSLKKDNLYISSAIVDQGPTLKRFMPRAMGRAAAIRKRTSHITVVLTPYEMKPQARKHKSDFNPSSKRMASSQNASFHTGPTERKEKEAVKKPKMLKDKS